MEEYWATGRALALAFLGVMVCRPTYVHHRCTAPLWPRSFSVLDHYQII